MNPPRFVPLETEARKRLRLAFASALLPLRNAAQPDLPGQVSAYVESLETQGWHAEQALLELKTLMREAGLQPIDLRFPWAAQDAGLASPQSSSTMVDDVVHACVQRRYAQPGSEISK